MKTSLLLLLMIYLNGAQATCDNDVINRIKSFWNGNPPKGSLQKLVGTITWLTAPSFYVNKSQDIACAQTFIDADGTGRDIVIFIDESVAENQSYKIAENEDGVLTFTGDSFSSDEKLHVIYLDNSVLAYYQCQVSGNETYLPFAGVGVVNAKNKDIDYSPMIIKGLKEADQALETVKLTPLPGIDTQCGN
ncbi:hypothetical protein J6590_101002 [Homalodisca vitripennis]|nr:hypothetical protein J6590_101002 [Homalodisca vitripennis]